LEQATKILPYNKFISNSLSSTAVSMGMFDPYNQRSSPNRSGGGGGIGSAIGGRLIGALILAAVALFMYMSQVEENPITGERQHVAISPDQEIRLGLSSAPSMVREMGGELPPDDPRVQQVQRTGAAIVDLLKNKKSPWQFEYHLLADPDTVNAFALPGGQIFITWGLMKNLKTEAQLAGVLGHETGHVIERHTAEQMAKSQFGQMLVAAVSSTASDPNSGYGSSYGPAVIAGVVNQMMQLRYGRQDELEADTWGIKLLTQLGYTPWAMVEVMEILKAADKGGGQGPDIFQTHPNPDQRIEQIKAYLKEHPPQPGLTEGRNINDLHETQGRSLHSLWR
jgi:predicted Zn-dependent protease